MTLLLLLLACRGPEVGAEPLPAPAPATPRAAAPASASAQEALSRAPTARLQPPGDVVAIGDVHSDPPAALAALRLAGVVDASGAWTGGNTWLVQTGDLFDRGPDSKGTLALFQRLEGEAAAAGGRLLALDGNHEVMNLQGDWRYVSPADLAGYGGEAARKAAFAPEGEAGRWVRGHDMVADVAGTIFVHGGVGEAWAKLGVPTLNRLFHAALDGVGPPEVLGNDGPLWNRAYLLADPSVACDELGRALAALGAERMVVGHTTQESGRIAERCGGRLYGIDTGLSAHYGGHTAALRIRAGAVELLHPEG